MASMLATLQLLLAPADGRLSVVADLALAGAGMAVAALIAARANRAESSTTASEIVAEAEAAGDRDRQLA